MPTAGSGAIWWLAATSTGTHNHQSPTASWEKQPCPHFTPSTRSASNPRKVFPQNRKGLPRRRRFAALNGIQPSERRDPELTRHRNFAFLNCRRRAAYSSQTRWMVSAPRCSKYSVTPAESSHRSFLRNHVLGPANGRAALWLVSLHQLKP